MARYQVLNLAEHRHLKINTQHSSALGDNLSSCWVYGFEMHLVQTCYPVFFQKDPQGEGFLPVALFGIESHQNLFLSARGWEADYIPMLIQREPFSIGVNNNSDELMVHINIDSPRVNTERGEAIFEPHGGHSQYLQNLTQALRNIHLGEQQNREFSRLLTEYSLIEPVFIDIPQTAAPDSPTKRLHGFYTINEQQLNELPAKALKVLQDKQLLKFIYLILASQQQMPRLIARYHQHA